MFYYNSFVKAQKHCEVFLKNVKCSLCEVEAYYLLLNFHTLSHNVSIHSSALKVCLEYFVEFEPPATVYQVNGTVAPWLRYSEWLLTCPV